MYWMNELAEPTSDKVGSNDMDAKLLIDLPSILLNNWVRLGR